MRGPLAQDGLIAIHRAGRGRRVMHGAAIAALLLVLVLAVARGEYRLVPPVAVADPVTIHVVDYGHHASLALPSPTGMLEEWFWGDWNYYAGEQRGLLDGARALFASPQSTLGRRTLVAGAEGSKPDLIGVQEILSIPVDRSRAGRLSQTLETRYAEGLREGERNHVDGRRFVRDGQRYSLFNNSAHEVARWLGVLGVGVRGYAVTARFRLAEQPAGAASTLVPPR